MEHTDAGAPVGLADTRLPEYAFAGNGEMPPAATCPVHLEVPVRLEMPLPPEVAVAPPHRGEESSAPGDSTAPTSTRGMTEGDIGVVGDDPTDSDAVYDDVIESSGVTPALPASQAPLREPAVPVAEVVDLRFASLFPEPMEWQERALCAQTDPEAFFPEKGGSTREAKRICSGCEVRPQCLEYALANDERFGIWGGMSERERRKQRRRAV